MKLLHMERREPFAGLLGESEAAALLQETLSEEKEADQKLTDLSEQINQQALTSDGFENEGEIKSKHKTAKAGSSR